MERLSKILAATDLSAPARHAVTRACSLAREVSAQVTLIHVLNRSALDDLRALLGARGGPIVAVGVMLFALIEIEKQMRLRLQTRQVS